MLVEKQEQYAIEILTFSLVLHQKAFMRMAAQAESRSQLIIYNSPPPR